jgi:arsenate reductase
MKIKVYGIPNCGTCKKAIAWLQDNNLEYEFINTKEHPPDRATIAKWVKALGNKAMRNTSGQAYRALGEARNTFSDEQWIAAFARDAMLLKRPLLTKNNQAILAGFKAPVFKEKLAD